MSLVLRRTYGKYKHNKMLCRNMNKWLFCPVYTFLVRRYSEDSFNSHAGYSNSSVLVENGCNIQELPIIVRKCKAVMNLKSDATAELSRSSNDFLNYHLIQAEFNLCMDLQDVFALFTKCSKITPYIALGAIERIHYLEKNPNSILVDPSRNQINYAKGAILNKLLEIVVKIEDTQTILNVMKTESTIMEPYKHRLCDELLTRVVDNMLSVNQLCEFALFLIKNNVDAKYSQMIDKLWVGFLENERDIDENNIMKVFEVLPGLKASKRTILALLEQKLLELWGKFGIGTMQDLLKVFIHEKCFSLQSFAVLGRWLNIQIHTLDEDSLLDIISKLSRLNYMDDQVEKVVEKYMKLKGKKVESPILIMVILNYCLQFKVFNEEILDVCSDYFIKNAGNISHSFLKSFIYPIGYLNFDPTSRNQFWKTAESIVLEKFDKINVENLCSIILAFIYKEQYPLKLVTRIYTAEYLSKIKKSKVLNDLHLIDTAMTLECKDYWGPLLPKNQFYKPIVQHRQIKNIVEKIWDTLVAVTGRADMLSAGIRMPHYCSDETYLIDVLLHPPGMGSKTHNWMSLIAKNNIVAILIHLPDHYCSNSKRLIGPQVMKKRQLKMLGMKTVSLKYSILSQYYTSKNMQGLKKYLQESIDPDNDLFIAFRSKF